MTHLVSYQVTVGRSFLVKFWYLCTDHIPVKGKRTSKPSMCCRQRWLSPLRDIEKGLLLCIMFWKSLITSRKRAANTITLIQQNENNNPHLTVFWHVHVCHLSLRQACVKRRYLCSLFPHLPFQAVSILMMENPRVKFHFLSVCLVSLVWLVPLRSIKTRSHQM